ncbi:glycoside hydrolase family 36 protein [Costertonia aggregata]|uniref:Alpha-galactosidase n=1 Tax=Costertonia aggregata TaxID=343403 RepID=A0A7H9ALN5_9FLAO|nr:glycoside hydrolase family 36 protein [Costertonia aggregata]QLG44370.1 alpha-galactosidase [Costertonia aggregata]
MSSVAQKIREDIRVVKNENKTECTIQVVSEENDLVIYKIDLRPDEKFIPEPIVLEWKTPALNVKGVWKPTSDFSKRIEADWELDNHESRISIDSPVISLFGNTDENVLCFSCSNAINKIELGAKYREEDDNIYCKIILFTECKYAISDFSIEVRVDYRNIHFSQALKETAIWWETFSALKPSHVPAIAKKPLYSTWYQFHQNLDETVLLKECRLAKAIGFEAIIIDDGWQTRDNNRGYDYTGDWQSERFGDFGALVKNMQSLGMKVGLWYSVPFCGTKSKAYQRFKGKFLTENHRWAPVFDPRFPEVRNYLVSIYVAAAKDWGLDGFKLDFIDDFKAYPDTNFELDPERDFSSINDAVDALLTQVSDEVKKVNPDIFIEFRQKYTGPAMRKYGNMLRAFDCPGDYTMNRVRIADIKMLCGDTAVHSDMVTWHFDEPVENAALHYLNTMFGVPQISVMLHKAPVAHINMIKFYTNFWDKNSRLLLAGDFTPTSPMTNYPIKKVTSDNKAIIGVFENNFVVLETPFHQIDILNVKPSELLVLVANHNFGTFNCQIFNCEGKLIREEPFILNKGVNSLRVPFCGMAQLRLITN